jgi:hypothetical protein
MKRCPQSESAGDFDWESWHHLSVILSSLQSRIRESAAEKYCDMSVAVSDSQGFEPETGPRLMNAMLTLYVLESRPMFPLLLALR